MAAHAPVDVVFVSPLSRTIQTALIAVPAGPRFIVEERVRERNGAHPCDKRRPRAELSADFPGVDFSSLTAEEDDTWTVEREPWAALVARASAFLAALAARPEAGFACVTHNDFLQALLLEAPDLKTAEPALRKKFANAEVMPLWFWAAEADADAPASPNEREKPAFSPVRGRRARERRAPSAHAARRDYPPLTVSLLPHPPPFRASRSAPRSSTISTISTNRTTKRC